MTSHPDQLQLGPENAQQRLVLLHGWGADADDLLDLGELLVSPQTSVVALRAPEPHPYGSGRQWYDLQPIDWEALPEARSKLKARLLALAESIPLERTVLLGFSQGAAMALDVGTALPFAGITACSGYPHQGWQPPSPCPPVLLTHGRQDPVVPFMASEELQQQLQASGYSVQLLAFDGGHGIDESLFPELKRFITERIAHSES